VLVIRRRPGETLVIAENIEIEILESSPSQVKLGIRAPKSIPVVRKEIQVTREQNQSAAQTQPAAAIERLAKSLKNIPPGPMRPV
jgi:carbon storage regulator